jgi:hypothetical protein
MNSSVLERRIRKSQILQQDYLNSGDVEQLADAITLRVLSRRATPEEVAIYKKHMEQNKLPLLEVAIDMIWMQLNSNEFLYNH